MGHLARIHAFRPLVVALVVAGCAVAAAACGSASPSRDASNGGIEFADCMRSHGVSNFPDPSPGGGIQLPAGANPQSPAFESAQKACSGHLPGGGPLGGKASESRKLQMLRLAQCMRAHGLSSFPDPTSTPPQPGNGIGLAFGGGGSFLAIPQSMIQTPGFKQAASACHFPGFSGSGPKAAPAG